MKASTKQNQNIHRLLNIESIHPNPNQNHNTALSPSSVSSPSNMKEQLAGFWPSSSNRTNRKEEEAAATSPSPQQATTSSLQFVFQSLFSSCTTGGVVDDRMEDNCRMPQALKQRLQHAQRKTQRSYDDDDNDFLHPHEDEEDGSSNSHSTSKYQSFDRSNSNSYSSNDEEEETDPSPQHRPKPHNKAKKKTPEQQRPRTSNQSSTIHKTLSTSICQHSNSGRTAGTVDCTTIVTPTTQHHNTSSGSITTQTNTFPPSPPKPLLVAPGGVTKTASTKTKERNENENVKTMDVGNAAAAETTRKLFMDQFDRAEAAIKKLRIEQQRQRTQNDLHQQQEQEQEQEELFQSEVGEFFQSEVAVCVNQNSTQSSTTQYRRINSDSDLAVVTDPTQLETTLDEDENVVIVEQLQQPQQPPPPKRRSVSPATAVSPFHALLRKSLQQKQEQQPHQHSGTNQNKKTHRTRSHNNCGMSPHAFFPKTSVSSASPPTTAMGRKTKFTTRHEQRMQEKAERIKDVPTKVLVKKTVVVPPGAPSSPSPPSPVLPAPNENTGTSSSTPKGATAAAESSASSSGSSSSSWDMEQDGISVITQTTVNRMVVAIEQHIRVFPEDTDTLTRVYSDLTDPVDRTTFTTPQPESDKNGRSHLFFPMLGGAVAGFTRDMMFNAATTFTNAGRTTTAESTNNTTKQNNPANGNISSPLLMKNNTITSINIKFDSNNNNNNKQSIAVVSPLSSPQKPPLPQQQQQHETTNNGGSPSLLPSRRVVLGGGLTPPRLIPSRTHGSSGTRQSYVTKTSQSTQSQDFANTWKRDEEQFWATEVAKDDTTPNNDRDPASPTHPNTTNAGMDVGVASTNTNATITARPVPTPGSIIPTTTKTTIMSPGCHSSSLYSSTMSNSNKESTRNAVVLPASFSYDESPYTETKDKEEDTGMGIDVVASNGKNNHPTETTPNLQYHHQKEATSPTTSDRAPLRCPPGSGSESNGTIATTPTGDNGTPNNKKAMSPRRSKLRRVRDTVRRSFIRGGSGSSGNNKNTTITSSSERSSGGSSHNPSSKVKSTHHGGVGSSYSNSASSYHRYHDRLMDNLIAQSDVEMAEI